MHQTDLELAEKHIREAYERIERQRLLVRRLRNHQGHRQQLPVAEDLLQVMKAICKNFRVYRKLIQQ